jgi:hypothetical protein
MKNIKVYESFRTEQEIEDLCFKYEIWDYQVRYDGSIDANWSVGLFKRLGDLKQLPLNFNVVNGGFDCRSNNLTTLEGCPKKVHGDFLCGYNKLTSLEHSPEKVEGNFICWGRENYYITSLEGLENTYIRDKLSVDYCKNLYSLKGFPKKVGGFSCRYTPIEPIYNKFIQECDYDTMRKFNKFDVIYTDGLDWFIDYDNLGKFLRSVGKDEISMEDFDDFIKTTEYKWEY